jgi:hypothetical protein
MMTMPTIAWDVDDVLNDLMQVWFEECWLPAHPTCSVGYPELRVNPPADLLGVPLSDYLASLDEFRLSGRYARLQPRRDVLNWFEEHGEKCHHVALTAVPACAASVSAEWVLRHFGRWIRGFHFIPSPRREALPEFDRTKADFLRRNPAAVLIDDNPANVDAARQPGASALLFPRPWNASTMPIPHLLSSLTGWAEGRGS